MIKSTTITNDHRNGIGVFLLLKLAIELLCHFDFLSLSLFLSLSISSSFGFQFLSKVIRLAAGMISLDAAEWAARGRFQT